jgi:hypothetical protein
MPKPTPEAPEPPERTPPRIVMIALGSALAPFVVQGLTMVLTGSVAATLLVGGLLAASFIAVALAFQAQAAGGWPRVPLRTRAAIVTAILVYHSIAFPVAQIVNVVVTSGKSGA